jgi:catechol 2,3-dioxygenase-like lactoylglutathione lyase family enzyme
MAWRAVPILPMSDPFRTRELYERLGFTVVDVTPEGQPPYLIAERDGGELHFFHWPQVDPLRSGFRCYLEVDDVDAVHADWASQVPSREGLPRLTTPEDIPWGLREMAFVDRDGTLVRVATRPH